MFIFDCHLDLSMNALEYNRDLTRPVREINEREAGLTDKPDRTRAVVSLPELRKGNIGIVVATQIARYVALDNPLPGWYSPAQAWAQTQGQLAWYRAMEAAGEMFQITDRTSLERAIDLWSQDGPTEKRPIGYILSLEGADSMITPRLLEKSWRDGLRALGPAHYGPGRYANGTDGSGEMGSQGIELLKEMDRLGIILDATHLCDDAFWQALDHFHGPVWASHNNCRALVDHNRQFSDEMIRALIARGAVIGGALDAWMMVPNWIRGTSLPEPMQCDLEKLVDHLDHICQIAGNANHIGIGTDLDGGYGREQCPYDLETIADLQKLPAMFERRGYTPEHIERIFHGNFLGFLRRVWK